MSRAQSKLALLFLLAVALVAPLPAPLGARASIAATVPDLYSAQVPAATLSGPPLEQAFDLALAQVIVKLTGQRGGVADPAARRDVGPAAPLVRQYQPVLGGEVRVSFDPPALRARLDAAGLPVWADDRPQTRVVLPADTAPGDFLAAAAVRGIPVVVSTRAEGAGTEPQADAAGFARAEGADLLLVGRPAPVSGTAALRWSLDDGADRAEWQGDLTEGAHGLADRLAARYAVTAGQARLLSVRITGVESFDAYGQLQAYLRKVGLIRSVELKEISNAGLLYELRVRGDVRQLNDAFALRRLLEPIGDGAEAGGSGEYLYRLVSGATASGP